ncbi:MAG: HAD-IA family hydrolase [Burkholderiales bacterium]|nr:HAD-IA family hydrolase [Burkholderiales bacterium]
MASAKKPSVDALLFDLGGVIVDIDFRRVFEAWSADSGVPAATLESRFSMDVYYERHERGEIPVADYFESLRSSLGIRLTDKQFERGWNAVFVREVPGIARLLRGVQSRFPLYVFSNSNAAHHDYWAREYASTLSMFRKVFVSSDLGRRKPEPQAYSAVAQAMGTPLPGILFFDDFKDNVEAARKVGMQAVHVKSFADIEKALTQAWSGK